MKLIDSAKSVLRVMIKLRVLILAIVFHRLCGKRKLLKLINK